MYVKCAHTVLEYVKKEKKKKHQEAVILFS